MAPFWSDIEGRHTAFEDCGMESDSVVFYQMYENNPSQNDAKTQYVIARAKVETLVRDSEFDVSWVFIVTWYRTMPYLSYDLGYGNRDYDDYVGVSMLGKRAMG